MKKIWQKNNNLLDKYVEAFTIGNDNKIDIKIAIFDIIGSIAHVTMLNNTKIINYKDYKFIIKGLKIIYYQIKNNNFKIDNNIEDIHSQVEVTLLNIIGVNAKKIHTGRSRNDQIITDIKLYLRDKIYFITYNVYNLFLKLIYLSESYKKILIPGYTHMQVAMPSSFGLLFASYAESLVDDLEIMLSAYKIVNKNPLGSAAGFGSSFPIDRNITTNLLGFDSLNINSLYAQSTRGKTEKILSMAISSIASTISKMSYDICLYMGENFNFIKFPNNLTTGSSIMPHKKNPDVFELIRAKCNVIQSIPNSLILLCNNMPSGYHRDFQNTKDIIFNAIDSLNDCIKMSIYMLSHIEVNDNILSNKIYKYIFSVDIIHQYLIQGMTFRDAYQKVGQDIENNKKFSLKHKFNYSHIGSIGNLKNDIIMDNMNSIIKKFNFNKYIVKINKLIC